MNPSEFDPFAAAARLVVPLAQVVDQRQRMLVSRLISEYRNNTLTPQQSLSGIAELAGLHGLLSAIEHHAKQGQTRAERLQEGI